MNSSNYLCTYCGKCFGNQEKYSRHLKVHEAVSVEFCSVCQGTYSLKEKLQDHLRKVHKPKERCGLCPYEGEKGNLARHIKDIHSEEFHCCSICGKSYKRISSLKKHERECVEGTQSQEHKCLFCGKTFKRKDHYTKHIRTHTPKETKEENLQYSCNLCDKNFKHKSNISRHKKNDHGNNGVLDFDGAGFGIFNNQPKKKTKVSSCQYCDYSIPNSWKLKRHIESKHKTELGLKKLQCDFCEKLFTDKWKLN